MICPSLGGHRGTQLSEGLSLYEQGIVDNTVLILNTREQASHILKDNNISDRLQSIFDVQHFDKLIRADLDQGRFDQGRFAPEVPDVDYPSSFFAVLLYLEEDCEIAKYVRENYTALDRLSGPEWHVFVIERSPHRTLPEVVKYWKQSQKYVLWETLGWTNTMPYDKASAYDIAREHGIPGDQIPCVVLLENVAERNKVVIPIPPELSQSQLSKFFRKLFASIPVSPKPVLLEEWVKFKEEMIEFSKNELSGREPLSQSSSLLIEKLTVNTDGGPYFGNKLDITGGDFVGHNKTVHGNEVRADKIDGDIIGVGGITDSSGIAIGRGAQARVNTSGTGVTAEQFAKLMQELRTTLEATRLDSDEKEAVQQDLSTIEAQLAKPEPKLSLITRGLNNVKAVIEAAVGVGVATATLSSLVQQALNMAQQLFK